MPIRRPAILTRLSAMILLWLMVWPSAMGQYFSLNETPKGQLFLDTPSDATSPLWPSDVYLNFVAHTLRCDSIYEIVLADRDWDYTGTGTFLERQVPGFGFRPTNADTPNLIALIANSYSSANYATGIAKPVFRRVRPNQVFRNNIMPDCSESSYSYPSSHSNNTWNLALLLASTNPWRCDTIVSRGIAHGQSRLLAGVHWQSDVDAGRLLGTACFARFFANPEFLNRLDAAKTEVCQQLGMEAHPSFEKLISNDDSLLRLTRLLPAPADLSSPIMGSEMNHYLQQSASITPEIVEAANRQVDLTTENVLLNFGRLLGDTITASSKPKTYELLDRCLRLCHKTCGAMQGQYDRPRPFDVFNSTPLTSEDIDSLRSKSPYPSLHAAMGWTAALTLVMLRPDIQDQLLKHGMTYGDNRVATGTTWYSDVNMGRIVACIALAYGSGTNDFSTLVREAQAEFSPTTAPSPHPTIRQ